MSSGARPQRFDSAAPPRPSLSPSSPTAAGDRAEAVSSPDVPVLVFQDHALHAYTARDLFLLIWRGEVNDLALDGVHLAMETAAFACPSGLSVVSVIERGATPPTPAQRATVRAFQLRMGRRIRSLALIVDGMGFWAGMALAVATSILSARRSAFPQHVCQTSDEGAAFIVKHAVGGPCADLSFVENAIAYSRRDGSIRSLRIDYKTVLAQSGRSDSSAAT